MFNRSWHFILRLVGVAPYREIRILMREIIKLEEECEVLKKELESSVDEVKSLWLMLDEMGGSSKISSKTINDFVDDLQDALVGEMLKDFDPVGEA